MMCPDRQATSHRGRTLASPCRLAHPYSLEVLRQPGSCALPSLPGSECRAPQRTQPKSTLNTHPSRNAQAPGGHSAPILYAPPPPPVLTRARFGSGPKSAGTRGHRVWTNPTPNPAYTPNTRAHGTATPTETATQHFATEIDPSAACTKRQTTFSVGVEPIKRWIQQKPKKSEQRGRRVWTSHC